LTINDKIEKYPEYQGLFDRIGRLVIALCYDGPVNHDEDLFPKAFFSGLLDECESLMMEDPDLKRETVRYILATIL
jgi:hypothetical protein